MTISLVASKSMDQGWKKRRNSRFVFENPKLRGPNLVVELFKRIEISDRKSLEGPFLEEVLSALSKWGGDKASRSGGFSFMFWRFC